MSDVRRQLESRALGGVALVTTPTGGWLLGWDPQLASFTAHHASETGPGGALRLDHELGTTRAAFPSPGALEEGLGFPLPSPVRAALDAERDAHPALAAARGMELGVGEAPAAPRDVGTFPVWSSQVAGTADPDAGASRGWGLSVERDRDRHAAVVDLGDSTLLEILGARPESASGTELVSYRLSHGGRVVLAGDDVRAPAGVDISADDSARALLAVIVDPDPDHRPRLLSDGQRAFLAAHGPRLLDAAAGPPAPYPPGTRVAVDVDGRRHLGRVAYPVTARDSQALAYAWTPDVASLVGHPWRRNGLSREGEASHTVITPAAKVTPTLAGPEIGAPGPGEALSFGAVVALAHPDSGERVEATVLRAFAGRDHQVVYQVEPHTLDNTEPLTVAAEQVALVRGTWWPTPADLMAARAAAGLAAVSGELLPGTAADASQAGLFGADAPDQSQRRAATPQVSAAEREAALLVGLDPKPTMVTVDVYGQLARVGDPDHGWLIVPFERWAQAMAHSGPELRSILATSRGVSLNGNEPVPTLAALAARHAPDRLASADPPAAAETSGPGPGPARRGLRLVRGHDGPGAGL